MTRPERAQASPDTSPRAANPALPDPAAAGSEHTKVYDVVIVGGGAAGLSAAVVLGRARRSVLVIDAGEPRNAPAQGVHGFLTRDGLSPAELVRLGRAEAQSYGARFLSGRAAEARRTDVGLEVVLEDGTRATGRRLLVATGLIDALPEVPGLHERWGIDVLHCPYCHGWEVRDQAIGILGTSPRSVHQALLFRQWSDNVTLFLHTEMLDAAGDLSTDHGPTEAEWEQLAARGIGVAIGPVDALEVTDDALTGVRLASGHSIPIQALVVATGLNARAGFLDGLGVQATAHPLGVGTHLDSDETGRVRSGGRVVPGLWTAGNATNPMAQVMVAAAAGISVAAAINAHLIGEEIETAVAAYRHPFSVAAEADNARRLLGDRRHGLPIDVPDDSGATSESGTTRETVATEEMGLTR
jgi:thioredoxin reductase